MPRKIMFNRPIKRGPWGGGGHFITSFYEYLNQKGHEVVFSLESGIDVIFMFDPRPSSGADCVNSIYNYKLMNPSTKIIQRINDTDIARPLDRPWRIKMLLGANQISDYTIFISEWVKDHYIEKGFNLKKPNSVVVNGCKSSWYYPSEKKSITLDNIKLITHHWSDNFMKGFDVYNFLDEFVSVNNGFSFTYMGRYNSQYVPKNTNMIPPTYGLEVGDILRSHDVYVTGARFEACGMHHIEAARCGLPVLYHRDGGGVTEVCKSHGIEFSSIEDFQEKLEFLIDDYSNIRSNIDYDFLSSERCFAEYEKIIQNIM
jgi:glycosyltransferase involved in cell wall biosynthesis